MATRLRSYPGAQGKPMPVEAKALACGCNGTSETFSNEAGKPTCEGRSPVPFTGLGGCQLCLLTMADQSAMGTINRPLLTCLILADQSAMGTINRPIRACCARFIVAGLSPSTSLVAYYRHIQHQRGS